MKKKRVAIYLRCSTSHQDLTIQREQTEQYVSAHNDWRLVKTYQDHGVSGTKDSRPELDKLLEDCRNGKIDIIVVKSIDRFARSLSFFISSVRELSELKVEFHACRENLVIDGSPTSKLISNLLAVLAEFERELIRERTLAGLERAKAEGRLGRKRVGFDVQKAVEMKREGLSYARIATELGISVGSAFNYLNSLA